MPIASTDLIRRLSGGGTNTDPNLSLGGAISSTAMANASLHNLFDQVSSAETSAGDVEYRCIYVLNNHATLTLQNAVAWVSTNTPDANTTIDIGIGAAAAGTAETAVANESTAPTGVTFSAPSTKGTGLTVGNIGPASYKAIWVRRTITAGAAANNSDSAIFRVEGDSAA